ncbi:MAG: sortase [Anaerolineae bacterium]|nr:sortase [Anaerolineae bacterium]
MGSTNQPARERRIPLGLALLSVGALLLATVVAIYIILPVAPPPLPAFLFDIFATRKQTLISAPTVLPRSSGVDPGEMFRPALFIPNELPSEARADEAPTTLYQETPGKPARIVIPALAIDAPVREVRLERFEQEGQPLFRWQVPDEYAAGWHVDSAALGYRGNTVLNGHHNVHGAIFGDLISLPTGADIYLYDLDGNGYHYQVTEQELIPERDESVALRRANAHWMERKPDERITIITCWPRTDNTHRLVVVAKPAGS